MEQEIQKPEVHSGRVDIPKPKRNTAANEDFQKKMKRMRDRDSEMVTGIFKNLEHPASAASLGILRFFIKLYPGQQAEMYELHDGERYTIPRGVAHHLNNNCYYIEHALLPQGMGGSEGMRHSYDQYGKLESRAYTLQRKKYRFAFIPLDFMDEDPEMRPVNIITATKKPLIA